MTTSAHALVFSLWQKASRSWKQENSDIGCLIPLFTKPTKCYSHNNVLI